MEAAKNLLGCYRTGDANDPEIYTAAIIAVLSMYPIEIVQRVVDPRFGLPSKVNWLPLVSEVKAACEAEMEPVRRQQERDKIRAETAQLLLNAPSYPVPKRVPGTDYYSMHAKHGRPVGVFEQAGDEWNRWAQPAHVAKAKAKEAAA